MFGCICNEPKRLSQALEPVRKTLVAEGPSPGWGLGYVQGGEVLLQRHPRPATDIDFYEALAGISSDYVIAHATDDRADARGGTENTPPFRFRRWLFAQDAHIERFDEVRPALLEQIPQFMRRNIAGATPAEHVFHLFLALLHETGGLDDPHLPTALARRALRDTVATVTGLTMRAGGPAFTGNLLVTNSRSMFAVRFGRPIHVRRFKGVGQPKSGKDFRAVLIVSDARDAGEGFEAIPDRSMLTVTRDLQTDIVELDA
jgi:glutamine amidotransferase